MFIGSFMQRFNGSRIQFSELCGSHACTLLPETSCEARNCLLDRVSIVGTYDDRSLGFFGELLEEEE